MEAKLILLNRHSYYLYKLCGPRSDCFLSSLIWVHTVCACVVFYFQRTQWLILRKCNSLMHQNPSCSRPTHLSFRYIEATAQNQFKRVCRPFISVFSVILDIDRHYLTRDYKQVYDIALATYSMSSYVYSLVHVLYNPMSTILN